MRYFASRPQHSRPEESGQTLVLICTVVAVLLAGLGLVADIGSFRNARERMQTSADSAAIAGGQALGAGTWEKSAQHDAARNGFTSGQNGVKVTVYHPPTSGDHANDAYSVQVVISQPQPTYLMRLLGVNTVHVSVNSAAHWAAAQTACTRSIRTSILRWAQ